MSIAQILVQVTADASAERRVRIAAGVAQRHDASLLGVFLGPPSPSAFTASGVDLPLTGRTLDLLLEEARVKLAEDADQARRVFEDIAASHPRLEWMEPHEVDAFAAACRTADLIVTGNARERAEASPDTLVFATACPVLAVSNVGSSMTVGDRIVVAWNGSREAARALRDAKPLLQQASSVTGVIAGHSGAAPDAETVLASYFERHNISATVTRLPVYEEPAGEVLLRFAARIEADLLVMGLYGHSRMREFILGGMSRHMLEHSPIPLLLSP